jgi:hypothetical protein
MLARSKPLAMEVADPSAPFALSSIKALHLILTLCVPPPHQGTLVSEPVCEQGMALREVCSSGA